MTKEREVMFVLIIGAPGHGKTTVAEKFVQRIGKSKTLIIDPDGMEEKWFRHKLIDASNHDDVNNLTGICRSYSSSNTNQMFTNIFKNFRNGLLVLDDCRVYVESAVPVDLRNIFRRKRQMMTDIICIAHGFSDVPPFFFTFATHYILFRTEDKIERRKDVLNPFDKWKQIKQRVDQAALKNKYHYELIIKSELQND